MGVHPRLISSHVLRSLIVAGILAATFTPRLQAATSAEVAKAMENATKFIYSLQNKDGTWENDPPNAMVGPARLWGGHTALATYALLAAGENPTDAKLVRAIAFVKTADIELTYAVGIRDQMLLMLPATADVKKLANKDADRLLKGADPHGRYTYLAGNPNGGQWAPHNSPSQYGVLGMWACDRLGAEIPNIYWQVVENGWHLCQGPDGSWTYYSVKPGAGNPPTPQMTAAGVASLFITQEYLHHGSDCKGNIESPEIDRGMKWIGDHFGAIAGGYTWYGIERISVAGGYKYIGTHNWYQEGAERIVRTQAANGGWGDQGVPIEASFNLVFLARGRAPAVMNKLKYSISEGGKVQLGHWNQRPRDCFNFVNWMDRNLEARLNWQIVDLENGSVADLNDAPILYITGNQALTFSDPDLAKLRDFVHQGGLIVGNADCDNRLFSKGFLDLGKQLFPTYAFRDLLPDHPIFAGEQYAAAKWRVKPHVQAMSNGVREMMILPDVDLSRIFQGRNSQSHAEQYQLLNNIILYSCDKSGLREKGQTYLVAENPALPVTRTVKLARVQYDGNWDPEPYGWKQFAAILHNGAKIGLTVEPVTLGEGALLGKNAEAPPAPPSAQEFRAQAVKEIPPDQIIAVAAEPAKLDALIQAKVRDLEAEFVRSHQPKLPYLIAHLTGTGAFTLTDPQRKDLVDFTNHGGTLIIDAAGGSVEFATSAEKELGIMFGADAAKGLGNRLPFDHSVFHQPNYKIDTIGWRRYTREKLVGGLRAPRLVGIEQKGRIVVFFSREDLSEALVGEPIDGIIGYDPQTAAALVRNIILYATGGK